MRWREPTGRTWAGGRQWTTAVADVEQAEEVKATKSCCYCYSTMHEAMGWQLSDGVQCGNGEDEG